MSDKTEPVFAMDGCCRPMALANSSTRALTMPSPQKAVASASLSSKTGVTLGQLAIQKPGGVK